MQWRGKQWIIIWKQCWKTWLFSDLKCTIQVNIGRGLRKTTKILSRHRPLSCRDFQPWYSPYTTQKHYPHSTMKFDLLLSGTWLAKTAILYTILFYPYWGCSTLTGVLLPWLRVLLPRLRVFYPYWGLFDKCLLLYVQSWTSDDGRK